MAAVVDRRDSLLFLAWRHWHRRPRETVAGDSAPCPALGPGRYLWHLQTAAQGADLSYRRGLSEAEVAESADVIRTNAHSALTDLREILGVLRTAEAEDAPERPQPTLSDLPLLVDEAASAGLSLDPWTGS